MSQVQTFQCPKCGGALEYFSGAGKTISCKYCGASIVVPKEMRTGEYQQIGKQQQQQSPYPQGYQQPVVINVDPAMYEGTIRASRAGGFLSCLMSIIMFFVIGGVTIGILVLTGGF